MPSFMTLLAKLTLDSSEFESGLKNSESLADKMGNGLKKAAKVGAVAIGAAATAATGFAVSAVKAGQEFDATMSEVAAISGATGEDFDALRAKAQEMGASTKFSASESAEALTYMAMAGWKTEDMLGGIEGIMNLAAASGEDLASTSDIVTDALTAFGMSAEDSGHFADVLAAAASNANTNVSMLGESFKYVAPVAGTLGYSAEDTSIALGLMANAGIKASQGGTALRTVLTNMAKPTDDMALAMDALGVSLTDSEGNMNSLMDIMNQLRSGFEGGTLSEEEFEAATNSLNKQLADGEIEVDDYNSRMLALRIEAGKATEAEKAQIATMLAGKGGMSGLLAIVNASEQDFGKLTDAIYDADGAAAQMSETMQDNLQGDITKAKSAFEGLKITLSDKLTPSLRGVAQFAAEAFSKVTEAMQDGGLLAETWDKIKTRVGDAIDRIKTAIQPLIDKFKDSAEEGDGAKKVMDGLADAIGDVADFVATIIEKGAKFVEWLTSGSTGAELFKAAVVGIVGALVTLTVVQKAVSAAQAIMNAVMSANPIGLIIAAVAALVAGFIYLWNNCEGFREFWINLWEAIKAAFNAVVDWLKQAIEDIVAWFTQAWEDIKSVWEAVSGFFSTVWEAIKGVFSAVGNWFKEKFETARDNIKSAWVKAGDWFGRRWTDIKTAFKNTGDWFKEKFTTAKDNVVNAWSNIKEKFDEIWQKIKDAFNLDDVWNWGRDLIDNFIGGIKEKWDNLKNSVASIGQTIKDFIGFSEPKKGPLSDFHTYAPDMMDLFIKGIKDNEGRLQETVESAFDFRPSITGDVGTMRGSGFSMGGMTVNVYGSDGMSVRELADEVERRIVSSMRTLSATYA